MKKSRFSEEQITYALRLADGGSPGADVCRQLGISEATFYVWKKEYANLGVSELRQLRQLQEENARLKRVVADLTLDKHILTEVIRKKPEARSPPGDRKMDTRAVSGECTTRVRAGTDAAVDLVLP